MKRQRASQREWEAIREGFAHEVCVTCALGPVELHHIIPRSQGGDDTPENLVALCRAHHTMLEGHEPGWEQVAAQIRVYVCQDHDRWHYCMGTLAKATRFDRRYPYVMGPNGPTLNRSCGKPVERGRMRLWCDLGAGHGGPCQTVGDEVFQEKGRGGQVLAERNETEDAA